MKLRLLFLLVPLAALAVAHLAREPEHFGTTDASASPGGAGGLAAAGAIKRDAAPAGNDGRPAPQTDASGRRGGCEIVTHYLPRGDGTVQAAYACEAINAASHPYASYSNAALESLAYADAKAAEILGMRVSGQDDAKAISLIIRSSALAGGDVAPLLLYSQSYPHPSAVDGVPVRKTVHTQYVLAAVVDLLAADSHLAATWEETIRRYSTDPDTEIALLQAQAVRIVGEMRQIQRDVTGEDTIGGWGDA